MVSCEDWLTTCQVFVLVAAAPSYSLYAWIAGGPNLVTSFDTPPLSMKIAMELLLVMQNLSELSLSEQVGKTGRT